MLRIGIPTKTQPSLPYSMFESIGADTLACIRARLDLALVAPLVLWGLGHATLLALAIIPAVGSLLTRIAFLEVQFPLLRKAGAFVVIRRSASRLIARDINLTGQMLGVVLIELPLEEDVFDGRNHLYRELGHARLRSLPEAVAQ